VSTRSRLDRLEAALPAIGAVVAWLERVHTFGSMAAYAAEQARLPSTAADAKLLVNQVRTDAERRFTQGSPATVKKAIWQALQAADLRIRLVAALEEEALTRQPVQLLEQAHLADEALILLHDGDSSLAPGARVTGGRPEVLGIMRALFVYGVRNQLIELYSAAAVRSIIERRYLAGHPAVFPATAAEDDRLMGRAIAFIETVELVVADGPLENPRTSAELAVPDLRIEVLRTLAESWAPAAAAQLVDRTRVDHFRGIGDDAQAAVLEARLRRTSYRAGPTSAEPGPGPGSA
jgi:hypothetical protein